MTADIIQMPKRNPPPTGAREAVRDALGAVNYHPHDSLEIYDHILAELWTRGFKVVSIDDPKVSITGMDVIIDPSVPEGMILVKDDRAKNIVIAMLFSKNSP